MRQESFAVRPENSRANANFLSKLVFWFTLEIFKKAWKWDLTYDDLTQPLTEHRSSILGEKLHIIWSHEVERSKKHHKKPKMIRALIKLFRKTITELFIATFIMELLLKISVPLFLKLLLKYYSEDNEKKLKSGVQPHYTYLMRLFFVYSEQGPISETEAAFFTIGLILSNWLIISISHPYLMEIVHLGMKMRIACSSLVYRKALTLKLELTSGIMIGNVINLLSNDLNRFDNGITFLPYIFFTPVQIAFVAYFVYMEFGISAVYGIIALILILPLQIWLALRVLSLRYRCALKTDERMREMNELIQAIQVIKMYTWEQIFTDLISQNRKLEVKLLRQMGFIKGVLMSFIIFSFRFAIFISCVLYVTHGGVISAEKVFVVTAFLLILRQTVTVYLPQTLSQGAELIVSLERLEDFLQAEETRVGSQRSNASMELYHGFEERKSEARLIVTNCSVELRDEPILKNINLGVQPGLLTAVIGQVGSGKSCLLHLILGELEQKVGEVEVKGNISYASQEPWLFSGTIRQNILFGEKFNRKRYNDVCHVCALDRDFHLMALGDKTLVGEKGGALSGGQRARINLARAIYKEADIYLLDDPLSAVDTHVGQHLFDKCINGYISDKIVVLVTHQLQFLEEVSQIVLMKDGQIEAVGDYQEIKEAGLDFSKLLIDQLMDNTEKTSKISVEAKRIVLRQSLEAMVEFNSDESILMGNELVRSININKDTINKVHNDVYVEYFKAGANLLGNVIMFSLFIGTQLLASVSDFFISKWIDIERNNPGHKRNFYILVYASIIVAIIVTSLVRSFNFFYVCMTASKNLHAKMFKSVIETRMYFYNTQGSGAILNRFSNDLGAIDELLPNALIDTVQIFLNLAGVILVMSAISPYYLIPITIMIALFYIIRRFYLIVSNNIKRLESALRSPVYSHVNSTLQGLPTIRSSRAENLLILEFDEHQDRHSSAWFMFISTSRAFGYYLDSICVIYLAAVSIFFMFIPEGSNFVGLAITQALSLLGLFQWGLRQSTELSNQMVSVERIIEFTKLEPEPNLQSDPSLAPPHEWPISGKVEFSHAYMKYGPQDDTHVLKDVSFVIQDKEKIGVVGRTGAGKSSLIAALFRLAYFYGVVLIDNLDVSRLCLHDLRRKISIIPQEPVLFSGTFQLNLDPFNEFDEDTIMRVLIDLENKDAMMHGINCLQHMIVEGGVNVSVGQRQIICLARALLRNNKIIVMDEATANIDAQTDKFIQSVIRTKFSHCTVITIAHRLHTIMDSDRILVMDEGQVKEFDHPHILLSDPNGIFTGMVERTGSHMADSLKKIAKENYRIKMDTLSKMSDHSEQESMKSIRMQNN